MTYRRAGGPVISVLYGAMFGVVCAAGGMQEGAKLRECPVQVDGRRLQRIETNPRVCHYAPPPRGLEGVSTEELHRMYVMRRRMERTE